MEYLQKNGVRIIERNFRNRYGEIDIIGYDDNYLVFFEVKYRKNDFYGLPQEAVTFSKQRNICRVAQYFCVRNRIQMNRPMRFDVISICAHELKWYKNAFDFCG